MEHHFREAAKRDVAAEITRKVLDDLLQGTAPWVKSWTADGPKLPLRSNGIPYTGINVLLLWMEAHEKGYSSPNWMTFRQAAALGGHVRKGEHGAMVVYANTIHKTEHTDEGDIEKDIRFLKQYTVFNVQQIDGLPTLYYAKPPPKFDSSAQRIAHADAFFRNTGARVVTGDKPSYNNLSDIITMPALENFSDAESYYGVISHEFIHWTKGEGRIARDFGRKIWGDAGYAYEEIVAEMGAAILCADLDIEPVVSPRHSAYIASWIRALQDDRKFIIAAAAHAQRAADYLHSLQPVAIHPDPEPDTPGDGP